MKYFLRFTAFFLLLLALSCSDESYVDSTDRQFKRATNLDSHELRKEPYTDEVLDEFITAFEKAGFTHKELEGLRYDELKGRFWIGEKIISEAFIIPFLDGSKTKKTKGYTFGDNHINNSSEESPIRCIWGQSAAEFEDYKMITTYTFDSQFPAVYKNSVQAAFDEWENGSNGKFEFVEVATNGYMDVEWYNENSTFPGSASAPSQSLKGYHLGDVIRINGYYFDYVTGIYRTQGSFTDQEMQDAFINLFLHEIGHNLGLAHFHDAATSSSAYHVTGTAVATGQIDVSIVANGNTDPFRTTLFPDDILTIQTLYPYSGGSSICYSENSMTNILNEGFSGTWAMGDVNFNGSTSSTDLVLIRNHILGNSSLSTYAHQKAAAIQRNSNTTVLAMDDHSELSEYLIGNKPWDDDITTAQWLALGDANHDGILSSSDGACSILPCGMGNYTPDTDYTNRTNFISEVHKTCAMMDMSGSTYTSDEYNTWTDNF